MLTQYHRYPILKIIHVSLSQIGFIIEYPDIEKEKNFIYTQKRKKKLYRYMKNKMFPDT